MLTLLPRAAARVLSGVKSIALTQEGISFSIENQVNIAQRPEVRADFTGRPLRYAKGYEPHALHPASRTESLV